jgi:hypothetical protein
MTHALAPSVSDTSTAGFALPRHGPPSSPAAQGRREGNLQNSFIEFWQARPRAAAVAAYLL